MRAHKTRQKKTQRRFNRSKQTGDQQRSNTIFNVSPAGQQKT